MPQKRLTVDRIENGIAVCFDNSENKVELTLDAAEVQVSEGDIIEVSDNGSIVKLTDETARRRDRINALFDKIKNKSDKV